MSHSFLHNFLRLQPTMRREGNHISVLSRVYLVSYRKVGLLSVHSPKQWRSFRQFFIRDLTPESLNSAENSYSIELKYNNLNRILSLHLKQQNLAFNPLSQPSLSALSLPPLSFHFMSVFHNYIFTFGIKLKPVCNVSKYLIYLQYFIES